MAKRKLVVKKYVKSKKSHKTKKRLEAKKLMLEAKKNNKKHK